MVKRPRLTVVFLTHTVAACYLSDPHVAGAGQLTDGPHESGFRGFVCRWEDGNWRPVANARVTINFDTEATTNRDGRFFFPHDFIRKHSTMLLVLVRGRVEGRPLRCARWVDYVTGVENATFRLWQNAAIRGCVISPDRQPVAGAKVSVLMDDCEKSCCGIRLVGEAATSDMDGGFVVEPLYPYMRYKLWVLARGRERKLTDWISVDVRESGLLEVVLRDAPGFVAGRVIGENGKPIAGRRVVLGSLCRPSAICSTDKNGEFRIGDLVPGREVTIHVQEYQKVKVATDDLVITVP